MGGTARTLGDETEVARQKFEELPGRLRLQVVPQSITPGNRGAPLGSRRTMSRDRLGSRMRCGVLGGYRPRERPLRPWRITRSARGGRHRRGRRPRRQRSPGTVASRPSTRRSARPPIRRFLARIGLVTGRNDRHGAAAQADSRVRGDSADRASVIDEGDGPAAGRFRCCASAGR
jgi:hypothetical protein